MLADGGFWFLNQLAGICQLNKSKLKCVMNYFVYITDEMWEGYAFAHSLLGPPAIGEMPQKLANMPTYCYTIICFKNCSPTCQSISLIFGTIYK